MKRLTLAISILCLSACSDNNPHTLNTEISSMLSHEIGKTSLEITSVNIGLQGMYIREIEAVDKSENNVKFTDYKNETLKKLKWSLEAECNDKPVCTVKVDKVTLQSASVDDYHELFAFIVPEISKRLHNVRNNVSVK